MTDARSTNEWWRGAVIYQIYPRSFLDSDGDGVGDLQGVIRRLDYLASLGVDAIWLSPFYTSPMRDFGYDVADYCRVDPVFGDLSLFDDLVREAHRRGLKVVIDQVYSHSSDLHPWFAESRASRDNAKADWYVWADAKPDGAPPTNWQSVFAGSAWSWDARRRQYYLHNFLDSQPDLNLHNKSVQDALLDVARFWLDRGVDGFRLDASNFYMHDPELRDNPPAAWRLPPSRPFDFQRHLYNQSHPDIPKFLERVRGVVDRYAARFTVAEVVGPAPLAEMKAFTEGNARLHSAYNFDFLYAPQLSPALVKSALGAWMGGSGEGWPSWAFSNHDAPRAVSRWAKAEDRTRAAKLYALLLLSLRGGVFLYQGEELGLPQAEVPFTALKDPEAIANWPLTLGRDGARTPMPWRSDARHADFSQAAPWLPVDPRHIALAVDLQEPDPSSTLNFVRRMIALRRAHPALRIGDLVFLDAPEEILAFRRTAGVEDIICVFNLGESAVPWRRADGPALISVGLDESRDRLPRLSGYLAAAR